MRKRIPVLVSACSLALAAGGCGSRGSTGGQGSNSDLDNAVRGGTLNMLGVGDVDYMDPNVSYYSIGYLGLRMWSRQLFTYPGRAEEDDDAGA
jgi:peptide/nickel transport system substrate-binding protein